MSCCAKIQEELDEHPAIKHLAQKGLKLAMLAAIDYLEKEGEKKGVELPADFKKDLMDVAKRHGLFLADGAPHNVEPSRP